MKKYKFTLLFALTTFACSHHKRPIGYTYGEADYSRETEKIRLRKYTQKEIIKIAMCLLPSSRFGSQPEMEMSRVLTRELLDTKDPNIRLVVYKYRAMNSGDFHMLEEFAKSDAEKYVLYMSWYEWLYYNDKGSDPRYPKTGLSQHANDIIMQSICPVVLPIYKQYAPDDTDIKEACAGKISLIQVEAIDKYVYGEENYFRIRKLPQEIFCEH